MELIIVVLVFSIIAGILGRNRLIGFWGFFFVSLMVTPLITLVFLFFTIHKGKRAPIEKSS